MHYDVMGTKKVFYPTVKLLPLEPKMELLSPKKINLTNYKLFKFPEINYIQHIVITCTMFKGQFYTTIWQMVLFLKKIVNKILYVISAMNMTKLFFHQGNLKPQKLLILLLPPHDK